MKESLHNVKKQFLQRSAKFWDIVRDIEKGKVCSETDFDIKLLGPALQEVVKTHQIKRDPEVIVPADES